jgi:hypothetical protein
MSDGSLVTLSKDLKETFIGLMKAHKLIAHHLYSTTKLFNVFCLQYFKYTLVLIIQHLSVILQRHEFVLHSTLQHEIISCLFRQLRKLLIITKMITKKLLVIFSMALIVLMGACKKDTYNEPDAVCPLVLSTIPADGATRVALNQTLSAKFNEKMDASTITNESFTLYGAGPIAGTVSYNDSTAFFNPTSPLKPNTTYTASITTTVKDLMGNALQTDYVWRFSTGATLSPTIIATSPKNNATGVAANKVVTATFSVPMNATTINTGTFLIHQAGVPVAGAVTYSGNTASFTPSSALAANTTYTGRIKASVTDASGIAMQSDYAWTFSTGSTLAPTIIFTSPTSNAVGVVYNKTVTATFSNQMDPLTITTTSFTLKQNGANIVGAVSTAGSVASFNPTNDLLPGRVYTATITSAVKSVSGTALANNYEWSFTTATAGAPTVNLKTVEDFGIIAGVGISNNAGFSEIRNMDVGISPGVRSGITGFPPAIIVNGNMYASNDLLPLGVAAMLIQAKQDLTDAYLFAEGASSPAPATVAGDLGGTTLAPGIYKSTSTLLIQSGDLTLDAQGDANAVWIFQIASDFTTIGGAGGDIILSGGAQAKNIYWQTGSSATICDGTSFKGNVLALTSITMNSNATAEGRMLARNGSEVLTSTNIINQP